MTDNIYNCCKNEKIAIVTYFVTEEITEKFAVCQVHINHPIFKTSNILETQMLKDTENKN